MHWSDPASITSLVALDKYMLVLHKLSLNPLSKAAAELQITFLGTQVSAFAHKGSSLKKVSLVFLMRP